MITSVQNVQPGQLIAVASYGADAITVGGVSSTPSGSVVFVVVFCDMGGNVVGTSAPLTLISGAQPNWGPAPQALYLGLPDVDRDPSMHLIGDVVYILIESVVGTWTISAQCKWLPGVTKPF